ncbi:MAG: dihydrofolate reductase family protein [Sedimentisphaerales bacterium]|nr:dihydrofolate reductase family protein [Sedimentisphaerales bacterium]
MTTSNLRVDTTLFLVMSVDAKITSGKGDNLDSDTDWKRIVGVKEGYYQYYDHEMIIAKNSLNTGRVMEKIGINTLEGEPQKDSGLTFIIVDRKPHLNNQGVRFLAKWVNKLFIVTNNSHHPAYIEKNNYENIEIIYYDRDIDFEDLFIKIKQTYGIDKLTIQSGGTLNTFLIRKGLIDHLCLFIAPLLVGGVDTSTLLDGPSIQSQTQLSELKAVQLTNCEILKNSFLRIEYDVVKETKNI